MHKSIKILIVDDEIIAAMSFRIELQKQGYTVCDIATNSEMAIDIFNSENPDIIIMDIALPEGFDGIETSKILKKYSPGLPIIFITGYDNEEIRSCAMNMESVRYLTKPVFIDDVVKEIEELLDDIEIN